jgi:uncharacterized repeat protein (TIGR01451 family)
VTKVADRSTIKAGETVTYTIKVTNPSSARMRSVKVCDRLPAGLVYVSSTPKATLSNGQRCWNSGTLGARKSKRYKLTARATTGTSGSKTNRVTATSPDATTGRTRRTVRVLPGAARAGGVTG